MRFLIFTLLISIPVLGHDLGTKNMSVISFATNNSMCSAQRISGTLFITATHCLAMHLHDGYGRLSLGTGRIVGYKIIDHTTDVALRKGTKDGFLIFRIFSLGLTINPAIKPAKIASEIKGDLYLKCYPVLEGRPVLWERTIKRYHLLKHQNNKILITHVPVYGGCSGGGLFNKAGELVALTIWKTGNRITGRTSSVFYDLTTHKYRIDEVIHRGSHGRQR